MVTMETRSHFLSRSVLHFVAISCIFRLKSITGMLMGRGGAGGGGRLCLA